MNAISTVPFLCSVLGLFWLWLGVRSARRAWIAPGGLASLTLWLTGLGLWGLTSARFAATGFYGGAGFLRSLPGFWLPFAPTLITVALLALPSFRRTLNEIVLRHPRAFVLVQALRIAAVGGVVKGFTGLLPPSFALPVGIPDLAFGLSALALALFWRKDGWTARTLILWNLVGIAVIMPAPLLMQMSLPGPLHTFTGVPDARALLEYPMVLAPTLIVPLFITMNAIHAVVLWRAARTGEKQT